jgi:phospholipid/cholesterol/gamma-HCH transport system substrate-binding protein
VILDGVDIGRLTELNLQIPPKRGVVMTAQIRSNYNIPKDVRVTVASKLLGGSPALAFYTDHLPDEALTDYLAKDGSAQLDGQIQGMLTEVTNKLQTYLEPAMQKLNQVADDFSKLSSQWTTVGDNIANMTEPRTLADVDNGKAQANINTLLARADERMAELKATIDHINNLVGDEKLKTSLTNMIDQTTKTATAWEETAKSTKVTADSLSKKLYAMADDMSATIRSTQMLIDKAATGKGTVSKLLNDPTMYTNLNETVIRLNAALDEIKLLIQKIKAEGVNVNL